MVHKRLGWRQTHACSKQTQMQAKAQSHVKLKMSPQNTAHHSKHPVQNKLKQIQVTVAVLRTYNSEVTTSSKRGTTYTEPQMYKTSVQYTLMRFTWAHTKLPVTDIAITNTVLTEISTPLVIR